MCIAFSHSAEQMSGRGLVSGQPIPLGPHVDSGPLALPPSIVATPVGVVNLDGRLEPDLVVLGDRFYPGLYGYRFVKRTAEGLPVFSEPKHIGSSMDLKHTSAGSVFQMDSGRVLGVWFERGALLVNELDTTGEQFTDIARIEIEGLANQPRSLGCFLGSDERTVTIYFGVNDGRPHRPLGPDFRDPQYLPYRPDGIWNGTLPQAAIYRATIDIKKLPKRCEAQVVLPFSQGATMDIQSFDRVGDDLVFGTRLGGMYLLADAFAQNAEPLKKYPVVTPDGISIRTVGTGSLLKAYPGVAGAHGPALINFVEGGAYYYDRQPDLSRKPQSQVYRLKGFVHQDEPLMFAGTLVVPNCVDWDGDGALDVLAGNSQGQFVFFKNRGNNTSPAYDDGQLVEAAEEPIMIQAGYRGSIQGPGEARWGYLCPTVVDWNQDGLLDVVSNDVNGIHLYFKNVGTPSEPELERGRPLYLNDLEMHGTWRTRPAAGVIQGRMAYVTLDDDDEFHLYWQVDERNLEDGGKLRLENGDAIGGNFLKAGGTGRIKFELADIDQDGTIDLLVGTPRHASIPDPDHGLPQSLGLPGSSVLFLRNIGSDANPRFDPPRLLHHRGEPVYLGQHSCSPTVASIGPHPEAVNLIVGDEHGLFTYFASEEISWKLREEME